MLTIADIMTDEVFSVAVTDPVEEVVWALAIRNIGGAPVRDDLGRLVGTVTKADLADPERGAWSRASRSGPTTVGEVMSPRIMLAHADEPAMKAVRLLAGQQRPPHILVVDRLDRVVGIVTPMDVLKALVAEPASVSWEAQASQG
jgi:CBS-domain-containing membrane protein